ncbi:uncharacterized protein LOC132936302 [Metopolophium dirhodum]|uniref:uncharacterized protein LOC132936302 n=1 Tax=Metopolophium dirhodum TaxID=44670 RepID=UPI0029907E3D|nr:uncharacterized protein LOC132936302 [Metopolophium dirhodum]
MSQLLNLTSNDKEQLANFMGHDLAIHNDYYKLPDETLQISRISKILLAMESGNVHELRGKTLEEFDEYMMPNDTEDEDEKDDSEGNNDDSISKENSLTKQCDNEYYYNVPPTADTKQGEKLIKRPNSNGLIDICSNHRGAYDTVHMLMVLPLLPTNCMAEGFETARINLTFNLNDYNEATDGGQVREPQRQVWIDQQRNLDRSLRLFIEGRYSMSEFLICARHSTPNFGVIRPQHQAIIILPAAVFPQAPLALLPLPVDQYRKLQLPAIPVLHATALPQAPLQEAPTLLPLHVDQHQELIRDEIMRRILPRRPAVPVPRDSFYYLDADADNSDEDVSNEQSVIPSVIYIERVDLTIVPIVEETCYICLYSPPTIVAYPCLHQGLCGACHDSYSRMPPNEHRPYYRCPLCRAGIEIYYILT